MAINIQESVKLRRESLSRLTPVKHHHIQEASRIYNSKNGIIEEIQQQTEIKENIGQIPGFFPTPKDLASEMVDRADLLSSSSVLEPSAGAGAIALAIREAGINPKCIEISYTLYNRLVSLGFDAIRGDFMEHLERYDRIIMNPPFENGKDIDHVMHAYDLLNAGGRIVAIMSNGCFYRSDKKATAFRAWIESLGGTSESLPDGTFKESRTMVSARLAVIDKANFPS